MTISVAPSDRKYLKDFIQENCIWIADPEVSYDKNLPKGFIHGSTPGSLNNWLIMLRRISHNPRAIRYIADYIIQDLRTSTVDPHKIQLCGLETSSIPLITAIQLAGMNLGYKINSFTVRKDRKKYGLFNLIDGIPNKHPFIVIDDYVNSTGSINRVCDTCLYELGLDPAPVSYCIMRNDVAKPEPFVYFNGTKIRVIPVFDRSEFDFTFKLEQYWLPTDVDKSINKRPDYI